MIDFILLNIYIGFQSVFFKTETYRYLPYKDSPYTLMYHFLSIKELTFSPTYFPLRMIPMVTEGKFSYYLVFNLSISSKVPIFSFQAWPKMYAGPHT